MCCQHFDSELRSVSTTPRFELCSSNTLVLNCRMHQHFFLMSSRIDTFIIPCLGFVTNPFGVRYEPFWGFVTNPFGGSLRIRFGVRYEPFFGVRRTLCSSLCFWVRLTLFWVRRRRVWVQRRRFGVRDVGSSSP